MFTYSPLQRGVYFTDTAITSALPGLVVLWPPAGAPGPERQDPAMRQKTRVRGNGTAGFRKLDLEKWAQPLGDLSFRWAFWR